MPYRVNLPAVDFERFEARDSVAGPIAVGISETEAEQHESQLVVHGCAALTDVGVADDSLSSNVWLAAERVPTRRL
jgi:hypothetical protein